MQLPATRAKLEIITSRIHLRANKAVLLQRRIRL